MRYSYTAAVERAFQAAASWSTHDDSEALELPEVLVGLVAEPECRAALILARHGVDLAAIRQRWPELAPRDTLDALRAERFSPCLRHALAAAQGRLFEYPQPLELATEHVLLGIVANDSEAAAWLRAAGLEPEPLEAEVHRLAGHQPGPLDWDDSPLVLPTESAQPNPTTPVDASAAKANAKEATPSPAPRNEPPGEAVSADRKEVGVLRILDAAANRAAEGLRVVEDYVRFVLDDGHLARLCKDLRHALAQALTTIPQIERHAARDSAADVGATITNAGEQTRTSALAVLAANFKRVEQSLRSLEEFAKIDHSAAAGEFERLRYAVYTLEKAADITQASLERLATAQLYVLIDGAGSEAEFSRRVETLVAAGVHVLQLRDKSLADGELLARARLLRRLTTGMPTLFIMNDRPDLAALSAADGVHVGQDEVSVKDARAIVGPRALVGVSTHSIEQARAAVLAGANYIGVGPTFPSTTKQFPAYQGVELLRQVAAEIRLPAFAIGGIDEGNLPQVLEAGFRRVAVSGAVSKSSDPSASVKRLLERLG